MKYIQELHIKRFRGIKDLELINLGEINIFVGENNAGKTSILEAIGLMENPYEEGHIIKVGRKRELINNQSSSYTVFSNMLSKPNNAIEISGKINNKLLEIMIEGTKITVVAEESYEPTVEGFEGKISVKYGSQSEIKDIRIIYHDKNLIINQNNKIIPIVHVTPSDHLMENTPNDVVKRGKKQELIKLLNIFDQDIVGLEMVDENRKTVPYIEHNNLGLMPLATYGDGLKKVLLIGSSIIKAENGVLLIDEVETAIHTDALSEIFKWFIEACKRYKTQVFLTTHSIEVIDTILDSQRTVNNGFLEESLRIITLKNGREGNKTKVRNLNGIKALEAREDFGLELR